MASIRLALLYSSLGRYFLMLMGLVSTMIVARLLTPAEIGTFAIASSVVMIMAEFRILGANAYLVREKELTAEKIRSAYGLTILISWGLGFVVLGLAYPLADYFEVAEVAGLFAILSFGFLMAPYISIPDALLSREFRFRQITTIKITAALLQFLVTVTLILQGFSFWSLAIANVCSIVIQVGLNLYFTRDVRIYRPRFIGLRAIAKFGIYTSLGQVLRKAQHTAPDIIIGKLGSPSQVGIFSRGLGFIAFVSDLILSGIHPVALPYLSEVHKKGESMFEAYLYASKLIAGIVWPVLAVASVVSLPTIRIMFGDQWDQAAPIASAIAIWGIFRAGHVLAPKALIATGYESAMLFKETLVFMFFVIAVVAGYKVNGLIGAAYAFVLTGVFDFLLSSVVLWSRLGFSILRLWSGLMPSAIVSGLCWMTAKAISVYAPFDSTPLGVTAVQVVLILPLVWLAAVFVLRHPISIEAKKVLLHNIRRRNN